MGTPTATKQPADDVTKAVRSLLARRRFLDRGGKLIAVAVHRADYRGCVVTVADRLSNLADDFRKTRIGDEYPGQIPSKRCATGNVSVRRSASLKLVSMVSRGGSSRTIAPYAPSSLKSVGGGAGVLATGERRTDARSVNLAHAAGAYRALDLVWAEACVGGQTHGAAQVRAGELISRH